MANDILLSKQPLFSFLSDEQLKKLLSIGEEITLNPGDSLLQEGDKADHFYVILEGSLTISKFDSTHQRIHSIAHLKKGDTIGEMALVDQGFRSASAKAETRVKVLAIAIKAFQELAEKHLGFDIIWRQMAKNLSVRLRSSNETVIQALEKQLEEYKMRVEMTLFMTKVIVALCLFSMFTSVSPYLMNLVSTSTQITIPITLLCFIVVYFLIKSSSLPLSAFGLTLKNWRKSISETLFFTIIIFFILSLLKWLLIKFFPMLLSPNLFAPYSFFENYPTLSEKHSAWLITLLFYWLLVSPLQELVARGALQGSLEAFLTGKHRILKAILISNLIFSTAHLFLSFHLAIIIFGAGLYFGWLYNRHRTLVGVILAHALTGTWAFWILGI